MSAGVSRTGSEVSRTGISWTGSAVSRPGSEVSYVDGQSIVPFVHRATSAEHEHESAKRQRTLPFGLRLDKWRAVPQQPTHAPINRRPKRGAGPPYRTSEDSDPLKLGSEHDSSVGGAWRVQDFDEAQTSEPGVSKGPTTATPASEQSITAVSELPGTRPLALQALVHKLRVLSPPLGSPFVHSPGKSPASPMKKPGLLSLIVAATKGRGDVHLPKKDKQDTEWVMERMVQLLDNQDNILSHGFNETDAKMLGKFCQHLRVEKGGVVAPAGTLCKHLMMILEGKLAAYHQNQRMETFEAGSHVGSMGLTADNSKYGFTIVAEEDSFLALMPHQKLLAYIQDLDPAREEKIMNYCFEVLFIKNLEMDHNLEVFNAAQLIQNSFRAHLSRKIFWRIRNKFEAPSAIIISKVWRGHVARKWLWVTVPASVQTIQNAYRCRLAMQRFQKEKFLYEETLLRQGIPRVQSSAGEPALALASGEGNAAPQMPQSDRFKALKRWRFASMTRCFVLWKTYILILYNKVETGQAAVKNLMHGELYSFFRRWAELLEAYGDAVTPWRCYPGQLVGLSKDGREYEFLHGERLDGDTECGVLVEPLLSDKSVWRVQWLSTGKKSTYLTGSMGRYHLRIWNVESKGGGEGKGRGEGEGAAASQPQDDQQGFNKIKEALVNNRGEKMSMNVTAPFGGKIKMPCPRDSPWSIIVSFPPRCVHASVMMEVQSIEPSTFDAIKSAFGNIVSPCVDVRPRQTVQSFKKYTLVIPHRAVSTGVKYLALYYWPENRSGAERILHNVTFDDDYCTAEVDVFGIFCVVATHHSVPEIVYAKLKFPSERRDVTGRQLTAVYISTSFKGSVLLYPKAYLDAPIGMPTPTQSLWMTMPRFSVASGVIFETVSLQFAAKMDACKLTSWSGRGTWKGRPLRIDFEAIVQPIIGQSIGEKALIVSSQCSLLEHGANGTHQKESVKFSGPKCFRMQIQSAKLQVVLFTPSGHQETYVRALQARETLLDIRKWIAKAWLVEKCSSQKMNWFKKLRFFNLKEGEFLSFEGEALEPAGMVLPTIEMRPVQRTHHDYGTEGQVRTMQAIIRQELQVPYNGPPVFSSHPEPTVPGRTTSFVGGGAAFAGAKPHDYAHYKIKPFGDSDALLFGRPWKVPAPPPQVHQALHTQGSAGAHSMHASVPPTPATPNTPKWSPKVEKWYLMTTISPEGSAAGSMGSNKRGEGGIQKRPQSASAMLRRMSVVQRPLDEYLSHRPGYQPAQEEETRTMADYLMENERNSTVIPNRNPRARFHSARQIRTLNMQVDELAQRTEEALSLQVVHAPGKTVKERNWTVKAILKTPDIVDNLHLEGDGTVKYQDAETANSGAFTSRSWRPSSARPHRIPIPNYLLHDHE